MESTVPSEPITIKAKNPFAFFRNRLKAKKLADQDSSAIVSQSTLLSVGSDKSRKARKWALRRNLKEKEADREPKVLPRESTNLTVRPDVSQTRAGRLSLGNHRANEIKSTHSTTMRYADSMEEIDLNYDPRRQAIYIPAGEPTPVQLLEERKCQEDIYADINSAFALNLTDEGIQGLIPTIEKLRLDRSDSN